MVKCKHDWMKLKTGKWQCGKCGKITDSLPVFSRELMERAKALELRGKKGEALKKAWREAGAAGTRRFAYTRVAYIQFKGKKVKVADVYLDSEGNISDIEQ